MARKAGDVWRLPPGAVPTDDQVWRSPDLQYGDWSGLLGTSANTIAKALQARGWKRAGGFGGIKAAPCRLCKQSTPIKELDDMRCHISPDQCSLDLDAVVATFTRPTLVPEPAPSMVELERQASEARRHARNEALNIHAHVQAVLARPLGRRERLDSMMGMAA
jgi:hypothetical protein